MGIRLRAKVRQICNPPSHYIGTIIDGQPVRVSRLPEPEYLEIVEEDGAYFLYHLNAAFECFADNWFQSLEDAQCAALTAYGITGDDWAIVH